MNVNIAKIGFLLFASVLKAFFLTTAFSGVTKADRFSAFKS